MEADAMTGPKPPLHGVPVSLKDQFGVKGYDSTLGCAKYVNQPYTDDCNVVKCLRAAGAIPFCQDQCAADHDQYGGNKPNIWNHQES